MFHTSLALLLTALAFVAARPADLRCDTANWAAIDSPMPASIAAHCAAMSQPPLPPGGLALPTKCSVDAAPAHDPWLGYVGEPIETRPSIPPTTRSAQAATSVAPAPSRSMSVPMPTATQPQGDYIPVKVSDGPDPQDDHIDISLHERAPFTLTSYSFPPAWSSSAPVPTWTAAKRADPKLEGVVFVPAQDDCFEWTTYGSFDCLGDLVSPDYRARLDELFYVPSDIQFKSAGWVQHAWGLPYTVTDAGVTTVITTKTTTIHGRAAAPPKAPMTLHERHAAPKDAPVTMSATPEGGQWYSHFGTAMELFFTTTDVDGDSKITRVHVSEDSDGHFSTLTNKRLPPTTTQTTKMVEDVVTMTTTVKKGE